ncbi:MAG: hypothetical protein HQK98_11655 [Nitrospirae bacterium]|nr:hypothetical protein [Nitrospirota bacterium]
MERSEAISRLKQHEADLKQSLNQVWLSDATYVPTDEGWLYDTVWKAGIQFLINGANV